MPVNVSHQERVTFFQGFLGSRVVPDLQHIERRGTRSLFEVSISGRSLLDTGMMCRMRVVPDEKLQLRSPGHGCTQDAELMDRDTYFTGLGADDSSDTAALSNASIPAPVRVRPSKLQPIRRSERPSN